MTTIDIWFKALRVPFFTATIVPVLIGTAMAYHAEFFSLAPFLFILIASLCVHAGLNLANDYFDHKSGNDKANLKPTPFSGGSRVIQDGLLEPRSVLFVSLVFFSIAIVLGFYLNSVLPDNIFLYIGLIGIFIAFFYSAPPLKLGYNGLGEILTGLGFGTLIIAASYFVQTQSLSGEVILATVPLSILVGLILLINEFPDYEADKKTNKRNWVVLFGKEAAKNIYIVLLISVFIVVIFEAYAQIIPYMSLITLFSFPLALVAITVVRKNYDKFEPLLAANKMTIGLHLVFGLLFAASFVLDKLF